MSTVPPEPYEWTPEALTYQRTTDYHWPNFDHNATDIEGEWTNSEGIGTGPFGFGNDVKLTDSSVSAKDMKHYCEMKHLCIYQIKFLEKI